MLSILKRERAIGQVAGAGTCRANSLASRPPDVCSLVGPAPSLSAGSQRSASAGAAAAAAAPRHLQDCGFSGRAAGRRRGEQAAGRREAPGRGASWTACETAAAIMQVYRLPSRPASMPGRSVKLAGRVQAGSFPPCQHLVFLRHFPDICSHSRHAEPSAGLSKGDGRRRAGAPGECFAALLAAQGMARARWLALPRRHLRPLMHAMLPPAPGRCCTAACGKSAPNRLMLSA